MAKNILVLTGSPRLHGNTDRLADAFVEGALANHHQVTRFDVGRLSIHGCTGCQYCFSHDGQCRQDDDMQPILKALYEADVLIFASPIYWFDITAQLKAAIDRFYVLATKPAASKSAALLLVCGDTDLAVADGAIQSYQATLAYLQWRDLGVIVAGGVNDKGDIDGKESLAKARALGKSIQ